MSGASFGLMLLACLPSRAGWELKIDPPNPALRLSIPGGAEMSITIPQGSGNGKKIVFPSSPSPFVALGTNEGDRDVREIWDLRTKIRVGRLQGKFDWDDKMVALSPDGMLIAGKPSFRDVIEVRSTRTGRVSQTINLPGPFQDYVDFGPASTLLVGKIGDKSIRLYDLASGEPKLEIPLPGHVERKSVAFSGNRKYLAAISGWEATLVIIDLASGDTLAQEPVPKETCLGLAFSPDGKALAAAFEHFGKNRIVVWNAADGGELSNQQTSEKADKIESPAWYDGEGLSWLPDQSGFLILGHAIVDRISGKRVHTLPFDDHNFNVGPRRFVDNERMLIPFGGNRTLRVAPIPKEMVETAMKIVRAGGNAADAALPSLKPVDWSSVKTLTIPASVDSWNAKIDPIPAGRRLISNPIPLKVAEGEIRWVSIPSPEIPTAFVVGGVNTFAKQPKDIEGQPGWVERFDLSSGRSLGRIPTPGVCEVIAAGVDGASVLLVESKARDRLDLLSGTGSPLVSWRPYDKDGGEARAVAWADFIDAKRLLTLSSTGKLVLWSLPDAKPVYSIEGAFQGKPVLSGGRKRIAGLSGENLVLLDTETGEALGELIGPRVTPGQRIELKGLAFRADGLELSALYGNAQFHRHDLTSGKILADFPSPAIGGSLAYYGADSVLIDGKTLVDLKVQRALWTYASGTFSQRSPDGKHWLVASKFLNQPTFLASAILPERGMDKITAMVADPATPASLKPGWRVSLNVQIGSAPGGNSEAIRKHVEEQLTAKLRANGITVAPNQKVQYVVRVEEQPKNDTLELRKIGMGAAPGGPFNQANIISIPVVDLVCHLELADGLGQPIPCSSPQTLGMRSFFMILHLPPGETDVALYIKKRQWEGINGWSDSLAPPYFVSRQGSTLVRLPGFTNLSLLYSQ